MTGINILLNGIDEGLKVVISTRISGAESPSLVIQSVQNVFPDFNSVSGIDEPSFGNPSDHQLSQENISMNTFLRLIHQQAILDTALDVMSLNLINNYTSFEILRQASMVNKIAFNLPNENPLGGVIRIELWGEDLPAWIEAATWHKGRDLVPRRIDDERTMNSDGEASTWY